MVLFTYDLINQIRNQACSSGLDELGTGACTAMISNLNVMNTLQKLQAVSTATYTDTCFES